MKKTRRSWAFVSLLLAGTLVAGCAVGARVSEADGVATPPDAAAAGDSLASAPAPAEEAEKASSRDEDLGYFGGPSGGEWKVDERGWEYYEVEVERRPEFSITRGGKVMLPPGVAYDLAEVRDDTLVVKIYNPDSVPINEALRVQPGKLKLDDPYDLNLKVVDRVGFRRLPSGLPDNGQWRQGFELADMNGDGNLDIVHGPTRKGDGVPKILLGDGAGGWHLWREARFEGRSLDYGDVAVADFNGDGELDIAFAVHLRGVMVMVGDGNGTFREWGEGLPYWEPGGDKLAPAFSSRVVLALDWNRDGRPDLLTVGEGPRVVREPAALAPTVNRGERGPVLFLNQGGGKWQRYDQGTGRTRIFGDGLAAGDFDGDGVTDFAVASRVAGATRIVKMGKGDGTWEDVALPGLVRRGLYAAVHAADSDGDGRDELFFGYSVTASEGKRWAGVDLLEIEDGTWRRVPLAAEPMDAAGVTALASGKIDDDELTDLVALTGDGQRWILLGAPGNTFVRERADDLAPTDPGCQGYSAEVLTVDGGTRTLLLMGFAGESGSEKLLPGVPTRCRRKGSLEAWEREPIR